MGEPTSGSFDGEDIARLLTKLGWPHTRINEDTWRATAKTRQGRFTVHIHHDQQGFLTFAIVPYLRSPEDAVVAAALYDRLLRLNQEVMFAAFSIDDDLDVVLSVDFPTAELDRSEFEDALSSLIHYGDRYYAELTALAEAV